VRKAAPRAAIVCCGVPDVGMSPLFTGNDHATMQHLSREHDATVRDVARAAAASFVDLYAVSLRAHNDVDRFLSDDRFHPSDVGYALFANALSPVLLRAIDGRRRT
jgi:lysophospholipase L1-like esterase